MGAYKKKTAKQFAAFRKKYPGLAKAVRRRQALAKKCGKNKKWSGKSKRCIKRKHPRR